MVPSTEEYSPLLPLGLAMLVLVGLQIGAEAARSQLGRWLTKPAASALFLVVALTAGALDSTYGILVLTALGLSWIGDVLLIPAQGPWFRLGLGSFLVGHLAYAAAFAVRGSSWIWSAVALCGLVLPGVLFYRYLRPHLGRMKAPITAYIGIISVMVALGFGLLAHPGNTLVALGAAAFYGSDMLVARHRFVAAELLNRALGLPLYYGAQLALASTVG